MLRQRPDIDTEQVPDDVVRVAAEFANSCELFKEGTGARTGLYCDDLKKEWADWAKYNFKD